ncbi:MAG: response regulator [Prolixibacteraceae bacterium]
MDLKVLIADDHKILRDGLRKVIEQHPGITVTGEAANGREAVKYAKELQPDVVLMDITMQDMNGMEATRRIVENLPDTKVIALSMHSNKRFVLGMLKAGAYGYLLKECDTNELIHAIKTVASNQKYITPNISGTLVDEFIAPSENPKTQLSAREKEILQLITEGKSSKEIAGILFLSSKTVDVHRKNIMDKLQLYSIPELTKYAIKTGLTSLDD